MKKPAYHILLCNSYRVAGEAQGVCNNKEAGGLVQYINDECMDRGIDAVVTSTACLNNCQKGPIMVVHPNNFWYGEINTEEKIDEILDALEENECLEEYLIAD